jgi:hypothetical protein
MVVERFLEPPARVRAAPAGPATREPVTVPAVVALQRAAGNHAVGRLLQRLNQQQRATADTLIADIGTTPAAVGFARMRACNTMLNAAAEADLDDDEALAKAAALWKAIETQLIPIVEPAIRPVLTAIAGRLTSLLGAATPPWVAEIPRYDIVAGDGISGGVAIGDGVIAMNKGTGRGFVLDGGLEFTIAHEIGHTVSGKLPPQAWAGILRTDAELLGSGVAVEATERQRPQKLEEVRADLFGAEMLAAHQRTPAGSLAAGAITPAISAPADAEHPSTKERQSMLSHFLGIVFPPA